MDGSMDDGRTDGRTDGWMDFLFETRPTIQTQMAVLSKDHNETEHCTFSLFNNNVLFIRAFLKTIILAHNFLVR